MENNNNNNKKPDLENEKRKLQTDCSGKISKKLLSFKLGLEMCGRHQRVKVNYGTSRRKS